ncbi:MAG: RsmD family RNA methyltransferase [Aquificota bacterium]|uniref:Methyltransferase n=1 Tax=Hydrogenobacter sp. TaxID=2152829 RepID=A0A7C2Z6A8_9AQUI|nr:RsmD family RNA methyltransferase [Aquificaceae bacterium]HAV39979.1 methyltransferase [Aquificaceae bacterium]HCO39038.1 methyltransferase [Aquificaceae bacterium]
MKKARRKQKIRPTSDLVKQAVFNILGDIEGLIFFDLFAGTGQMGIAAEERGAEVIFVEKNPKIAGKIRQKSKGKVIIDDVLKFLEHTEHRADVIFADPPYDYEFYDKLIELAIKNLQEGGIFILEHSKKLDFSAEKKKIYGDTALSIWRKRE